MSARAFADGRGGQRVAPGPARPPGGVEGGDRGRARLPREPLGRCEQLRAHKTAQRPGVPAGGDGHRRYHTAVVAPFLPDAEKLAAVREALPAVSAGIYLDTPRAGPLPAETARSMSDLAGWELATGRAGADRREEAIARVDEARAAGPAILSTDVHPLVPTPRPRGAFAIVAAGRHLRARHPH